MNRGLIGALSTSVAIALLAGCSASQPPIGVPGAMPQGRAIANLVQPLSSVDLIYVGVVTGTDILTYPYGKFVASFSNYGAMCSNLTTGDVFLVGTDTIYQYAHGGTQPIATVAAPSGFSFELSCTVEKTTGDLAAVVSKGLTSEVAVYPVGKGSPTLLSDTNMAEFDHLGYDDGGNLFALGFGVRTSRLLTELPSGSDTFNDINVKLSGPIGGAVEWDGSYITSASFPEKSCGFRFRDRRVRS